MEVPSEDFDLPCSDDELSSIGFYNGKHWQLDPTELDDLYNEIDKTGVLNLEWKNPGRRAPSPVQTNQENAPEIPQSPVREEKSDFDFMDEVNSLRLRVRRDGVDTLRGSAKKKTTSFDGILSSMIRHKRIKQLEEQAGSAPPAPSSNS